jgi:hypothetical protein
LTVAIPDQLDRAEARKRTEACVAQFRQQSGGTIGRLDERWDGDTMHFTFVAMGTSITGRAFLEDRSVRLEVDLPWMLSMLGGSIKQSIEERGRRLLGSR